MIRLINIVVATLLSGAVCVGHTQSRPALTEPSAVKSPVFDGKTTVSKDSLNELFKQGRDEVRDLKSPFARTLAGQVADMKKSMAEIGAADVNEDTSWLLKNKSCIYCGQIDPNGAPKIVIPSSGTPPVQPRPSVEPKEADGTKCPFQRPFYSEKSKRCLTLNEYTSE